MFAICEGCGGVHEGFEPMCPDCPIGAEVVTVDQIKDAIRAAATLEEVNDLAKRYGAHVKVLDAAGGEKRTMAIQIRNLASYRRAFIRGTQAPERAEGEAGA